MSFSYISFDILVFIAYYVYSNTFICSIQFLNSYQIMELWNLYVFVGPYLPFCRIGDLLVTFLCFLC